MTTESANSFEGSPEVHPIFWHFHQIFPPDVVPLSTNRHGSSHWVYQPSRLVRGVFCRTGPQMTCNSATFKPFSRLMLVSMEKRVNKWPWYVEKNHLGFVLSGFGKRSYRYFVWSLQFWRQHQRKTGGTQSHWKKLVNCMWIDPMSALGLITCLFWIYFQINLKHLAVAKLYIYMSQTSLVYGWFRFREQFPKLKQKQWADSEGWDVWSRYQLYPVRKRSGRFSKVHPLLHPTFGLLHLAPFFLKRLAPPSSFQNICFFQGGWGLTILRGVKGQPPKNLSRDAPKVKRKATPCHGLVARNRSFFIIINNNNHNNCQGETVTSRVLGVWIVRWVFLDEFHRLFVACSRTAKNPKIVPSQLKMPAYNMYVCIWLLRERGRERVTTVDTTFMIDIFGCIQINFLIQIHKKCCIPTVQFPLTH